MVRPDLEKWGQSVDQVRRLAVASEHPRTRERFQALYMIAAQAVSASEWARRIGRSDEAVLSWVHKYNRQGPQALVYRRTGGRAPFLRPTRRSASSRPSSRANRESTVCPAAAGP